MPSINSSCTCPSPGEIWCPSTEKETCCQTESVELPASGTEAKTLDLRKTRKLLIISRVSLIAVAKEKLWKMRGRAVDGKLEEL